MKSKRLNPLTLPALFDQSEPTDPRKPLYFDLEQQPLSYAIFYNRMELVSELLKRQRVEKGEIIAIFSDNLANWAVAYFAITKLGAIALPLLAKLSDDEIKHILKIHEISIIFASQNTAERITNLHCKKLTTLIALENFKIQKLNKDKENVHEIIGRELDKLKKSAKEFINYGQEEDTATVDEDDVCCILHVPDTSGHLKEIRLTHKNLVSAALISAKIFKPTAQTRIMILLPLSLTLPAILGILMPLLSGSQAVFLPPSDNQTVLNEWLNRFTPTHLLVDSFFVREIYKKNTTERSVSSLIKRSINLFSHLLYKKNKPSDQPAAKWFKRYHWLICTNFAPLGFVLNNFLLEKKVAHHILFGLFETSSLLLTGKASPEFCWAQGKLIPDTTMRIVTDDPEIDYGELWVKGPSVAPDSVLHDPKAEGFFTTGYMARQVNGTLQILGPVMHHLNEAPQPPVFTDLIEAALNECPVVKEALAHKKGETFLGRVYLDRDQITAFEWKHPERLLEDLLNKVNAKLPEYAQLSALSAKSEPFQKNALDKVVMK